MLAIKKTKNLGRGLFATAFIKKGQVIEKSSLIIISSKDSKTIDSTILGNYVYEFKKGSAIALGLGSLFNHASNPNVGWKILTSEEKILFWATEDIFPGQQCFIDYGYDPSK